MDDDADLRWQVRLRSRADLVMVKELTAVLAALSGSTHGQVIAEAVKAYATVRMGERAMSVLEEVAASIHCGSASAAVHRACSCDAQVVP